MRWPSAVVGSVSVVALAAVALGALALHGAPPETRADILHALADVVRALRSGR